MNGRSLTRLLDALFASRLTRRSPLFENSELPARCPICRETNGPFFRLRYGAQVHSGELAWELCCPTTGWKQGSSTAVTTATNLKTFWYCRRGDIFRTDMDDWLTTSSRRRSIVVRIAGPIASGKSEITRELANLPAMIVRVGGVRDDSIPIINVIHTAAVGAGMEYTGSHEPATEAIYDGLMTSRNNLEHFLTTLQEDLPAGDIVAQMLGAAGFSDESARTWGDHRLPAVQQLSIEGLGPALRLTLYYFDLPGELWSVGQTIHGSAEHRANLAGGQHAVIAIDGALLAGDLDEPSLRESMRPTPELDVKSQQRERGDALREFLRQLAEQDNEWDPTNSLPTSFVITKADLIRAALHKRAMQNPENPLIVWLNSARFQDNAHLVVEGMLKASVAALSDLLKEIDDHKLRCSEGVRLIVESIPDPLEMRDETLRKIVTSILTHYANPAAFWELVWSSPSTPARIPGLARLSVGSEDDYWRGIAAGIRVQDRDFVNTVLGSALMHNVGANIEAVHAYGRQVRYFLTCSREIVLTGGEVDQNARGYSASSGQRTLQTHLIARTVHSVIGGNP